MGISRIYFKRKTKSQCILGFRSTVIPEQPGSSEDSYNPPANLRRSFRNVANDLIRMSDGQLNTHRHTSGSEMVAAEQRHLPYRYSEEVIMMSREGSDRDCSDNQKKNKKGHSHQKRIQPALRQYHSYGEPEELFELRNKGKSQRRHDLKRQKRVQLTPPELLLNQHLDDCFANILKNIDAAEENIVTDSSGLSRGSNVSYSKANKELSNQPSFEDSRYDRTSESPSTSSYRAENTDIDYNNSFLDPLHRRSMVNIVPVEKGFCEDYPKIEYYEDIPYQLPGQFIARDELNNPVFNKRTDAHPSEYHYHHHSHYYQGDIRKRTEQHDKAVVARRRGSEPCDDRLVAELRGNMRSHARRESAVDVMDRRAKRRPAHKDDNAQRRGRRHSRKYGAASFDYGKEKSPPPYDMKSYQKNSH